jgi:hypothetical protein
MANMQRDFAVPPAQREELDLVAVQIVDLLHDEIRFAMARFLWTEVGMLFVLAERQQSTNLSGWRNPPSRPSLSTGTGCGTTSPLS